ncbi:hypothetical protein V7S43_014045 [Phytophthora oleae]|uniref:Uncharacterized protein n=1 Tax=Phytophthora oleae TaxID=2107226 RepID=A0ABD3F6B8_9STRA
MAGAGSVLGQCSVWQARLNGLGRAARVPVAAVAVHWNNVWLAAGVQRNDQILVQISLARLGFVTPPPLLPCDSHREGGSFVCQACRCRTGDLEPGSGQHAFEALLPPRS